MWYDTTPLEGRPNFKEVQSPTREGRHPRGLECGLFTYCVHTYFLFRGSGGKILRLPTPFKQKSETYRRQPSQSGPVVLHPTFSLSYTRNRYETTVRSPLTPPRLSLNSCCLPGGRLLSPVFIVVPEPPPLLLIRNSGKPHRSGCKVRGTINQECE